MFLYYFWFVTTKILNHCNDPLRALNANIFFPTFQVLSFSKEDQHCVMECPQHIVRSSR